MNTLSRYFHGLSRTAQSAILAGLLELFFLILIVFLLITYQKYEKLEQDNSIEIAQVAEAPKPSVEKPVAKPKQVVHPIVPPVTEPSPFQEKVVNNESKSQVSELVQATNLHSSDKSDPLATYASQVRSAVQTAVIYPSIVKNLRITGRVRVQFSLKDSVANNVSVITSSGKNVFDNAAILAVTAAKYPKPPESLVGQLKVFQVWVEFNH